MYVCKMGNTKKRSFAKKETPETENKRKRFLEKHGPINVAETIRRQEEAKSQYTQDVNELEHNIDTFASRLSPLLDPVTKQPLCWVRNPTQEEWESLVPDEFWQYRDNPEGVPPEISKRYSDHQFNMMANLIENPKKDVNWWKAHANIPFQLLFQEHLAKVYEDLGVKIANF